MTLRKALALALLLTAPWAAQADSAMPGMTMKGARTPATTDSTKAMKKMHKSMMAPYSGNPDVDFATHMMPHHQGAIDMAEIELKYGTDPEMRALAQSVVAAQETEIKQMRDWLAKHKK